MYPSFNESLPIGKEAEGKIMRLMHEANACVGPYNNDERFDFWLIVGGQRGVFCRPHLVEVKNEDKYETGENLFVEVAQDGTRGAKKRSGLLTSEASIWVHTLGDTVAVYRRTGMLGVVTDMRLAGVTLKQAGDNGNVGYLVNRSSLLVCEWYCEVPINNVAECTLWSK